MSTSKVAHNSTPLALLTEHLNVALKNDGPISLPGDILDLFKPTTVQDDTGIRDLVSLFGKPDHLNRLRLDHSSFSNTIAIILQLPYSLSQEKLLFAFMTTIEILKDSKITQAVLTRIKHAPSTYQDVQTLRRKIKSKLIPTALQSTVLKKPGFTMRTLAAHILYALVHGDADAHETLRKRNETRKLGSVVDEDDDYVLRVITANIIRELCTGISHRADFWPPKVDGKPDGHKDFPLAPAPHSLWVQSLADYLSKKSLSRGFQGDSQPVVYRLLSVATDTHAFADQPHGNILAVITTNMVLVVPGTASEPLVLLEINLDSSYDFDTEELTSPDFRPGGGHESFVKLNTYGKGHQIIKGSKNALNIAEFAFHDYMESDPFFNFIQRRMKELFADPNTDESEGFDESSHLKSRSSRRLDVGMVDISTNSDEEISASSESEANSLMKLPQPRRHTLSRSRSRQSSRNIEAKLKELYKNRASRSGNTSRQGSILLGEQQHVVLPGQTIDPSLLLRQDTNATRQSSSIFDDTVVGPAEVETALDTTISFAEYVDQASQDHAHGSWAFAGEGGAVAMSSGRGSAKPPEPHLHSNSTQTVEPKVSIIADAPQVQAARRITPAAVPTNVTRTSTKVKEQVTQDLVDPQDLKHRQQPSSQNLTRQPRSNAQAPGASASLKTHEMPKDAEKNTVASKTAPTLKRPQKASNHPTDWDAGEMVTKGAVPSATKKPRLMKPAAGINERKQPAVEDDSMHLDESGAGSMLRRPKLQDKSQKSEQKQSSTKHDEFDIDSEDDEMIAATTQPTKPTKTQGAKGVNKKKESRASKPTKAAVNKCDVKGRTALRPIDPNVTSLASTRTRRSQQKSKKYTHDSDSQPEVPDDDSSIDALMVENGALASKKKSFTTVDAVSHEADVSHPERNNGKAPRIETDALSKGKELLRKPGIATRRRRNHATSGSPEAQGLNVDIESLDEANPEHEHVTEKFEQTRQGQQIVHKAAEILNSHQTLVVASPIQSGKARRRSLAQEIKHAETELGKRKRTSQDANIDMNQNGLPDETAEDSYPIAGRIVQGPRLSFGSKLGQFLAPKPKHQKPTSETGTPTAPLSNAKSFIGTVNETRAASPTKKSSVQATGPLVGKATSARRDEPAARATRANAVSPESVANIDQSREQESDFGDPRTANGMKALEETRQTRKMRGQQLQGSIAEVDLSEELRNEGDVNSTSVVLPKKNELSKRGPPPISQRQKAEATDASPRKTRWRQRGENMQENEAKQALRQAEKSQAIDLTQDSDEAIAVASPAGVNTTRQDDSDCINKQPAVVAKATPPVQKTGKKSSHSTLEPAKFVPRAAEVESYAARPATTARISRAANSQAAILAARLNTPLLPENDTPSTTDTTTQKKTQLVHFGKRGPQNQGMPSPDKQARIPSMAPPETLKHHAYKQNNSVAAVPHAFVNAPIRGPKCPDSAKEFVFDDQGILAEDDERMQDVEEVAQYEEGAMYSKESTSDAIPRLLTETRIGIHRSASQASRVDQNGSPRLEPQRFSRRSHTAVSDIIISPKTSQNYTGRDEQEFTTSTEESASPESGSQDSDSSFHVPQEVQLPDRSDRTTRLRAQVTTAVTTSPRTVRQPATKLGTVDMKAHKQPRESLGLSKIAQAQYPQAEEKITTNAFKKPTLESAVSKTHNLSLTLPATIQKAKYNAPGRHRQALKENSGNGKLPVLLQSLSPTRPAEISPVEPMRISKSYIKKPLALHSPVDTSGPTPASLRTGLLAKQSEKNIKKEDTILENLNRGKISRRDAEDADRTLVEDNIEGPSHRRQQSTGSSADSKTPPPQKDYRNTLQRDKTVWREGSRAARNSVRDALMEITNTVLFRLENEEKAIELKVKDYASGGNNILLEFREKNCKLFRRAGDALLRNAEIRTNELDATFDRLQARKTNVRESNNKQHVDQTIKLRENALVEKLEQMLAAEKQQVGEIEDDA